MADQKIFSLIPESLREDLISEVKEILEERAASKQQEKPVTDPIFNKQKTVNPNVDPYLTAALNKNKK